MTFSPIFATPSSSFFTREDLSHHCTPNSLWVSLFSSVYDLTDLVKRHSGSSEVQSLLKFAGGDVSHFFDPKTKQPLRMHVYNKIGFRTFPSVLHGVDLNLTTRKEEQDKPWWKDKSMQVGFLTKKEVTVKIINVFVFQETKMVVPIEETLAQIRERYLVYNFHAKSYSWKSIEGHLLDMGDTLEQNGLIQDLPEAISLQLPEECRLVPTIFLHFNDDLTEM